MSKWKTNMMDCFIKAEDQKKITQFRKNCDLLRCNVKTYKVSDLSDTKLLKLNLRFNFM